MHDDSSVMRRRNTVVSGHATFLVRHRKKSLRAGYRVCLALDVRSTENARGSKLWPAIF